MKTERNTSKTSQPGSPGPSFISSMRLLALVSLIGGLFAGVELQAADKYPPNRLTYQGFLVDANGLPLATNAPKNYDVIFGIWDDESAGAAPLWQELQTVTVDNGNFSALLGEGAQVGTNAHGALSSLFVGPSASDRFVQLTVKGIGSSGEDVVLAPRLRLLASPYSFTARNAHNLVNETGLPLLSASGANTVIIQGALVASNLSGNGATVTNLNAGNLASGSIPDARLSTNVPLKNAANTFSANQVINAKLGIGVSPTAPLQVAAGADGSPAANGLMVFNGANSAANHAIVAARVAGTSAGNPFLSLDVNGEAGWSIGLDNADANKLKFSADWASLTSATMMTIERSSGNVGIGTTTPTGARLQVMGYGISSLGWHGYLDNQSHPIYNGFGVDYVPVDYRADGIFAVSVYGEHAIHANIFRAFSDERIKRVRGQSDSVLDLATLMKIEVTDYSYIDVVARGGGLHKKLIAQQVEKVYPQAVTKTTDVVPDIFKKAVLNDGWVNLATDLKVGERVRILAEKVEGIYEVLEVRPGGFRTSLKAGSGDVFVYGREVKDFRTVDYEAVAMLNVSATQELAKELAALHKSQERVTELELKLSKLEDLEKKVAHMGDLERELADLKKMVGKMVAPQQAGPDSATEPSESTTQSPR